MNIKGDYNYLSYLVGEESSGKTVKEILKFDMKISRRLINTAKNNEKLFLNGRVVKVSKVAYRGDLVVLRMDECSEIEPEQYDIKVIYEDKDVLVVDKEAGIVVHPTKKHRTGTLLNRVIFYAQSKNETYKPHLVNRLDRDTSGLLIIAKNPYAHYELMKQMQESSLKKRYMAITKGGFKESSGIINYSILDQKTDGINRIVSEDGKKSETKYKVLFDNSDIALVDLELITGGTHQIRVHLSELGHNLLGDELYGAFGMDKLSRQALHSYSLEFVSPRGNKLKLESKLPKDMYNIINPIS